MRSEGEHGSRQAIPAPRFAPSATEGLGLNGGIRAIAWTVLLVVVIHLGYGVSPLMASRCACAHGPEVPCDCVHHKRAEGSGPPPCHIHAKSQHAPGTDARQPCVRARCGSTPPDLILLGLVSTSEAPELPPAPIPGPSPKLSLLRPSEGFIFRLRHPPKAYA